jgi:hypothetical protein
MSPLVISFGINFHCFIENNSSVILVVRLPANAYQVANLL